MEVNELSKNARGGTELMLERLHGSLPEDLLSKFQIIPSRVRELDSTKKKIYWAHDLPGDNEAQFLKDAAAREQFDLLVFVSNWQYQQFRDYLGVPFDSNSIVIENGIVPFERKPKPTTGPINIIYFTTPHRGLELAWPAFKHLFDSTDLDIHFHVYSSFSIYGWSERDAPYEKLFDEIRQHPGATYYGAVSNEEIRKVLPDMHILAYPSIWEETSCLQLIEAMSAGLICVHSNLGALPDTSGGLTWMYQFDQDLTIHANRFANILGIAIENVISPGVQKQAEFAQLYANIRFDWQRKASAWKATLEGML